MNKRDKWLELDDSQLLKDCEIHIYKSSGPGGQHRNKVSSAVRLVHKESKISSHGDESRSQHENKALAVKRLRMNIACKIRCPYLQKREDSENQEFPDVVKSCIFTPKKKSPQSSAAYKLDVGRRDKRFWPVAAVILDIIESYNASLSEAAGELGISTGNMSSFLKSERHLFDAVQKIRAKHNLKPLR